MTDLERLRIRRERFIRPDSGIALGGGSAFLGQVISPAARLGVGKFFLARPSSILGIESENSPGILSPSVTTPQTSIPVYLIGPGVPQTGDYLVCRFVDYRWVAERSGGPGGTTAGSVYSIPSCACPVPGTLVMTSLAPTCNYGMFQSCTLQYGPPDPCFAPLTITANIFRSTSTFVDYFSGLPFYYYLYCQNNLFSLARLFCTSPVGGTGPYRDAALYNWLVGGYGNNCSPFYLHGGSAYPGSDASCAVLIDPA